MSSRSVSVESESPATPSERSTALQNSCVVAIVAAS